MVAPEDAAAQADQAMQNAKRLREEAGSSLDDVGKLRFDIGDRAYREPVYQVLGQHFGDVHPCSTGLIVRGFARPEILFEIDMAVVLSPGAPATASTCAVRCEGSLDYWKPIGSFP